MTSEKRSFQISIKSNYLKVEMEIFDEKNDDTYRTVYFNEAPIHEEFALAMQNLAFHIEKITGTSYHNLVVDGYYRQPSGNSELLTIYAHLSVNYESSTNMAVRLHLGKDEYAWIDRLLEDMSLCEREALLYITKGKRYGLDKFLTIENTNVEPKKVA